MLGWRLLISAILIPALAGVFWLDHRAGVTAPWLLGLAVVLAVRCGWELADLLAVRNIHPTKLLAALGAGVIVAAAWPAHCPLLSGLEPFRSAGSLGTAGLAAALWVLVLLASAARRFEGPGWSMETLGADVLILAYCGLLLAATAQLRWIANGSWGYLALGSLVVSVKSGDIGAYTIGRLFGRTKMAPTLSPGKTWAGFVGALLGATAGTWLWLQFAGPAVTGAPVTISGFSAIAFGMVMGIVGLVGDLCESLIKRDVGRKDAAALFPGFGGLLDLLDSVLYAGPVAWLWWVVWPPMSLPG